MEYFAGIDVGTSNIKGAVYSIDGKLINTASVSYKSFTPKNSYHEQNPNDWFEGVIKVLLNLCENHLVQTNLKAISLSTQGGTILPVDKNFNPLYNAITWLDRRGSEILSVDKKLLSKNIEFYNKTGWRLDTNMSFMPLYWLKENEQEVFKKINKIFFVNDYLSMRLTGQHFQDPSNSSITLFYNVKKGCWDKEIFDLINLNEQNFSEVKNSGEFVGFLKDSVMSRIGLKNKVMLINGGHDQYCASVGAGILNTEEILLATGTAWIIFKMIDNPIFDSKRFFSPGRSVIKDKFGLMYSIPAAGASINWFALNVMGLKNEKDFFTLVDTDPEKLANIKNNIIYHPYLTGDFGPDFNILKKASFTNIEIGHNYLDFIKSIMEGIGFQLKKILMVYKEKGIAIKKIKIVGGSTKDKVWPSIIADINNIDILIPEDNNQDFATKGAAIIAGWGAGFFPTINDAYNKLKTDFKLIKPNKLNLEFYNNKYNLF
ncbi:MAG: FGGY family carbohydrate kinase [Candidatus Humimicrobiaceae bacterium]